MKDLPVYEWMLFNEISASASKDGMAINDPELYRMALSLGTTKQIINLINKLYERGVVSLGGDGQLIINDDWLDDARDGRVQISGVQRWTVAASPLTIGFLMNGYDSCSEKTARGVFSSDSGELSLKKSGGIHTPGHNSVFPEGGSNIRLTQPSPYSESRSSLNPEADSDRSGVARPDKREGNRLEEKVAMSSFMPDVRACVLFERFWDTYPRHDRKDDAIRQWNRAVECGESPDEIVAGAQRYAEFARRMNQQPFRLFQAHNFIRGASFKETWGSQRSQPAEEKRAYLITKLRDFELWSNMHPEAQRIQLDEFSRFVLDGAVIYFDKTKGIFKSYEENFGRRRDGSAYLGPYWWTTENGRSLIKQKRLPSIDTAR